MKRRYTDADKWQDEWFLSLSNDHRMVWLWLCDNCTPAGRIKKNFKMLNFCCDTKLDANGFEEIFNSRVIDCGDFYFIPKFLKFQNPRGITSDKPAVVAIRKEIEEYHLQDTIKQSLTNDYLIIKGKGIGTGKGIGEEKEKVKDSSIYKEVVDHLNLIMGTTYRIPQKTKDLINARLNDKFTLDDFKIVHQIQYHEWKDDPKMHKYLRPETLYSNKFEGYLNQGKMAENKERAEEKRQKLKEGGF